MRGVICYYSGFGNTKLACEYLAARLGGGFDLHDVVADGRIDLAPYDVVGLAASTDFGGMPERFERFIAGIPEQDGTPAFVLNTYGLQSGRTLPDLAEQTSARGFALLGGHSVRMPESYPPMLALRLAFAEQPKPRAMREFDAFIGELEEQLAALERGEPVEPRDLRFGLLTRLARPRPRTTARDDMGEKFVDAQLCTKCDVCRRGCPYGAIRLAPLPVFNMDACRGCWRCYNLCPERAIYTKKFRGGPYYEGPFERTRATLRP